jgi:hypothetical protein
MITFLLGLILFLGVHSIGIFADQWRNTQVSKLGHRKWKLLYSVFSMIGLLLMTIGYKQHSGPADIPIWSPPAWTWYFLVYSNLVPIILLVATYVPHNAIKIELKDPMTIGVIIWAATHLMNVASFGGMILFTSFLLWAILDLITCRKRRANLNPPQAKISIPMTFITLILGLGLWSLFDRYAHYLRGIDSF